MAPFASKTGAVKHALKYAKLSVAKDPDSLESTVLGAFAAGVQNSEARFHQNVTRLGFSLSVNISYVTITYAGDLEPTKHPVRL